MADVLRQSARMYSLLSPLQTLCTITVALMAGLTYLSPLTAALTPVLLLPTIHAAWCYRRSPPQQRGSITNLYLAYFGNALLGPLIAITFQIPASLVALFALLGEEAGAYLEELWRTDVNELTAVDLARRKIMAHSPRYIAYLAILAYPLAGFAEESLKYATLRAVCKIAPPRHELEYVVYAAAAGLGFATVEGVGFVYAAVKADQPMLQLTVDVLERTVFSVVVHAMLGALTGLYAIRRDSRPKAVTLYKATIRSALYHGTIDFIILCTSAFEGQLGWVHPTGTLCNAAMISTCLGVLLLVARELSQRRHALQLRAC